MTSDTTTIFTQHSAFLVRTSIMHAVLDILGDPWNISILRSILEKPQRFDRLVEELGVSRPVLSARLERLCSQGCLSKIAYRESSRRHKYQITPMGLGLRPALLLLDQWNQRWLPTPSSSSVTCTCCGEKLQLRTLCSGCNGELSLRDVKPLLYKNITHHLPVIPAYRRTRNSLGSKDREEEPLALTAEAWLRDRWSCLIIGSLFFGLRRYGDFQSALAIASNTLAGRLDLLQQAEIVCRLGDGSYRLRKRGKDLYPAIMAMRSWGELYVSHESSQESEWGLLHIPCGEWLKLTFACASCGSVYPPPSEEI